MAYRVAFSRRAERQFGDLPRQVQVRLRPRIDALAENPHPPGVHRLSEAESLFRLRVGDYRIVYGIEEQALLVLVVKVGHRREVYRGIIGP
ncbi:MAG: type II toxin-antitoxin system RelE/ParE family toxin [Chloroflexi bacterium]|nr:type II toxin-antitoxin system RelE/ParE family toxin [Chloroflexota bacterium]